MKSRAILGAVFLAFLLTPAAGLAQEDYERGDLLFIETIKVLPKDAKAYEATIAKVVEAARLAQMSPDFKWAFMNDGFTYALVYPFKKMAYWDDPQQWMRAFQGTPGEAKLNEAFGEFSQLSMRTVSAEVVEHVKDWSYDPATPVQDAYLAHLESFWVASGKQEQFAEVTKEIMAFFKELSYPYSIAGHRTHFGDTDRATFVIWYNDRGAFYGANSVDKLVAKKAMSEKWGALMGRLAEVVVDHDHGDMDYKPNMSYWPEPTGATN